MPSQRTSVAPSDPLNLNNNPEPFEHPDEPHQGKAWTPEGKDLLVIAGPTGAGKSIFACELAAKIGAEIVCADAFQVYQGMAILTAQPPPAFCEKVQHHLFGVVPPSEAFDAARYAKMAGSKISEIAARGKSILLVGGSGMYLRALFGGLDEVPAPDPKLRATLAHLPLEDLIKQLSLKDPEAGALIDLKNPRRVARALEIVTQTGKPLAASRKNVEKTACRGFLIMREPEELKERIATNVESMFPSVVDEVIALKKVGPTASRAIGFREIQSHARGETSQAEIIATMTQATRQYAKRQLTWFRNKTSCQELMWQRSRPLPDLIEEALSAISAPQKTLLT